MKGGQGLPLNLIVIAAIAVLVLVLVVGFSTGTLGKLFGGTKMLAETATPEAKASFALGCKQACFSAEQLSDTPNEWQQSEYCKRTINITGGSILTHCWENPIAVECSKDTVQFGTLDQTKCSI